MYLAETIRKDFKLVPAKSGVYKWWCDLETLRCILKKIDSNGNINIPADIEKYTYKNILNKIDPCENINIPADIETLYCFYVGIAKNLRARIKWHIKSHTAKQVATGRISTLRNSLASIFFGTTNISINAALNNLIDTLYISFEENPNPHEIEKVILSGTASAYNSNNYVYILNIQENNHGKAKDLKKELKKLRNDAKQKALNNTNSSV